MTTRVKGRLADHLGDTPAFLQDMKDGEIRITEEGVYARYGPQIRKLNWDETPVSTTTTTTSTTTTSASTTSSTTTTVPAKLMLFDNFGDDVISPNWDFQSQSGNGGTFVEVSDRLEHRLNPRGKNPSELFISQTGIEGIHTSGDFNSEWGIAGKMHIPTLSDLSKNSAGEVVWARAEVAFSGKGNDDRVYMQLYWTGSQIDLRWYAYDGSNIASGTAVSATPNNEVWYRFDFLPKYGEIRMYYSFDPLAPYATWIGISNGKPNPAPGGHPNMEFITRSQSQDTGRPITVWFEEIIDEPALIGMNSYRTSNGGTIYVSNEPSWPLARDVATGEGSVAITSTPTWQMVRVAHTSSKGGQWTVYRHFLEFDLSSIPAGATIKHARVDYDITGGANFPVTVGVQESNYGTFGLEDYDDFTGPLLGSISIFAPGAIQMVLNAAGVAFIEANAGSVVRLAFREYNYDYLNVSPPSDQTHYVEVHFTTGPNTRLTIYYNAP